MANKLTRQEVYNLIDGERAYQNSLGPDRTRGAGEVTPLTQGETLVLINVYLRRAEEDYTKNPGEFTDGCQENLRKIAAMAVQMMEKYGCPARTQKA